MAKTFDDYCSFKVEKVVPKSAPKRRRFKLSLLFLLVLAWAILLQVMGNKGALSRFFTDDIPAQLHRLYR